MKNKNYACKSILLSLFILITLNQMNAQVNYFPWTDQPINVIGALSAGAQSDLITDANIDKLYFIASDSKVWSYYQAPAKGGGFVWKANALNNTAPIANLNSGLVFDLINRLYYIGTDGFINTLLWDGTVWQPSKVASFISGSPTFVPAQSNSRLAISHPNGLAKVYYTGNDNKIHFIQYTNTGWTNGNLNATSFTVRNQSQIITDVYQKVYYVGTDNILRVFYFNGTTWDNGPLVTNSTPVRTQSDLVIDEFGKVYYIGNDNKIHSAYYNGTSWIENVLDVNSLPVAANSNFTYNNGNIVYLGNDNNINVTYWDGCVWTSRIFTNPSGNSNVYSGNWKSRYYNSIYGNSYYFDNTGKPHLLIPKIDYSTNSFVYVKGKGLMLNNNPFYSKGINYPVDFNIDTRTGSATLNQYYLSRYNKFCHGSLKCTSDPATAWNQIASDFQKMKDLGINTVRICGSTAASPNSTLDPGLTNLYLKVYGDKPYWDCNGNSLYQGIDDFDQLLDDAFIDNNYIPQLAQLVNLASTYNLKIILLTGLDKPNNTAPYGRYAVFLSKIANYFKTNPTLMAIDICNEPPIDLNNPLFTKTEVCSVTKSLYDVVRNTGSKTLMTIGTWPQSVLLWDPKIMSVDFVAYHCYDGLEGAGNTYTGTALTNQINKILSDFIYATKITNKPWIVGETGYLADLDGLASNVHGTVTDQATYMQSSLSNAFQAGASGYLWWQFHDDYNFPIGYFGIYNNTNGCYSPDVENLKSCGTVLKNFNPICSSSFPALPSNYYNYDNATNYTYIGQVKDAFGSGIKNAYINGRSASYADLGFTYSDNNGNYTLKTDLPTTYFLYSAAGYQSAYLNPSNPVLNQISCIPSSYKAVNNYSNQVLQKINNSDFSVFPNPSITGIFNVNLSAEDFVNYKLEVYNTMGQLLLNTSALSNSAIKIDISNYPAGIYFLKATTNGTIVTKKIIK